MHLFLDNEHPHDVIRKVKGQYVFRNRNQCPLPMTRLNMRCAWKVEALTSDSVMCITLPLTVWMDNPAPQIRPFCEARFGRDSINRLIVINKTHIYDVQVCPSSVDGCSEVINKLSV